MPEKDQCLITIAAKWGTSTTIQGQIESRFYPLEQESPTSLENVDMAKSRIPFKFTLQANLTSTLAGLETITVSLQHLQYNSVNCKTDVDIKVDKFKLKALNSEPTGFSRFLSFLAILPIPLATKRKGNKCCESRGCAFLHYGYSFNSNGAAYQNAIYRFSKS